MHGSNRMEPPNQPSCAMNDDAPSGTYDFGPNNHFILIRAAELKYTWMTFEMEKIQQLFDFMYNLPPVPNPRRPSFFLKRAQVTFSPVNYDFGQNTKTLPYDDSIPSKIVIELQKFVNEQLLADKGYEPTNGCHVSLYPDGKAGVSPHEDNENVIDQSVPIVSISFGEGRRFSFYRHQTETERAAQLAKSKAKIPPDPKPVKICSVRLQNGDVAIMVNLQNVGILHGIDKEPKIEKPRLNLTFRKFNI